MASTSEFGSTGYCASILAHYENVWARNGTRRSWHRGPLHELPSGFAILEFPTCEHRKMWTYASVCMSQPDDESRIELHLHSSGADDAHVELLTAVAHYHRTGARLDLGHTVDFGRPWQAGSECSHGLISLPYLDGPSLEMGENGVRFLWLVPVTKAEVEFKKREGLSALEERFESKGLNYLDPHRPSVA